MTNGVTFTNHEWLVRSLDRNQNNKMDELQVDPRVKEQIDTDHDGQVSNPELVSALRADAVEINKNVITQSKGFNIYVNGLETLKNVHATAANGISSTHVWTPTMYSDDSSRERYYKLVESNRAYDASIDKMENSLRSIQDMTANAPDATSRAINIQAKTSLQSASWRTWAGRLESNLSLTRDIMDGYVPRTSNYGNRKPRTADNVNGVDPFKQDRPQSGRANGVDPFKPNKPNNGNPNGVDPFKPNQPGNSIDSPNGVDPFNPGHSNNGSPNGVDPFKPDPSQPVIPQDPYEDRLRPHLREQESINTNFQAAYSTLNSSLKAISEQTQDLPDIAAAAKATDATIARAFTNLSAIESDSQSASDVSQKLKTLSDAKRTEATGRAAPYAGIGAGVGAAAGAAIGFFAGGKNIKSALLGAGIGGAVSAGVGGLIGHSIDSKIIGKADELNVLADEVSRYQVKQEQEKVANENQNHYQTLFKARETHDVDGARVVTNEIRGVESRVRPIEQQSARILDAYRMK